MAWMFLRLTFTFYRKSYFFICAHCFVWIAKALAIRCDFIAITIDSGEYKLRSIHLPCTVKRLNQTKILMHIFSRAILSTTLYIRHTWFESFFHVNVLYIHHFYRCYKYAMDVHDVFDVYKYDGWWKYFMCLLITTIFLSKCCRLPFAVVDFSYLSGG